MNLLIVWKHETLWPRLYKRDRAPGTKSSSCWAEVQNTDSVISPKRAPCVPTVLYRQRNRRWDQVGLDFKRSLNHLTSLLFFYFLYTTMFTFSFIDGRTVLYILVVDGFSRENATSNENAKAREKDWTRHVVLSELSLPLRLWSVGFFRSAGWSVES